MRRARTRARDRPRRVPHGLGQSIQQASGTVSYDAQRLGFDLSRSDSRKDANGRLSGSVALRLDRREASLHDLTITLGRVPWRLVAGDPPPTVSWSDEQVAIDPIDVRRRHATASASASPARGGPMATARFTSPRRTCSSTRCRPLPSARRATAASSISTRRSAARAIEPEASGTLTIANGRVERVSYQKLAARFTYARQMFDIDARLDQAPGVWITAVGTRAARPARPPTARSSRSTSRIKSSTIEPRPDRRASPTSSATSAATSRSTSRPSARATIRT